MNIVLEPSFSNCEVTALFKPLPKDPTSVGLRDLRGQGQLQSQIKAWANDEAARDFQ